MVFDKLRPAEERYDVITFETSHKRRLKTFVGIKYMAQLFQEPNGMIRLQVSRLDRKQGISWDDLQAVKDALGYGDYDAVEVYPRTQDVVNLGNFRHLWIMKKHLDFVWRPEGNMNGWLEKYKAGNYEQCVGAPTNAAV
jgi:hypothetical protein